MNYEQRDISINKFRLDEEFIKQPDMMLFFSDELAEINKAANDSCTRVNEVKDELEKVKAEISLKIRQGEGIPEGIKITEEAIKGLLLTNDLVKEVHKKLYDCKYKENELIEKRDRIASIVDALRHRKSSLENLTQLYQMGYFSMPKSAEIVRGVDLRQKQGLNKNKREVE